MRKLMWFTMGFGAACAFCAYAWQTNGLWILAAIFAALSFTCLFVGKQVVILKRIFVVCLGISMGLVWFSVFSSGYLSLASRSDGMNADVTARCTDFSYETDYGTAVEGILYLEGKPFRTKFYVKGNIDMEPGDVLKGVFRLRVTTKDSADDPTFHQGKGIFLLAYQKEDAQLLKLKSKPFWTFPAMLRQHVKTAIDAAFPKDVSSFARALLLGDRSGIDYATNTSFRVAGIMHVIAVSGLHVTILFTLINLLCLKRRWLVAVTGLPTLILFAAVAGFTPSVVRACIVQGLMMIASLLDKEYDGPTELAFASLVMLCVNPLMILSVSFQLSVGCIIGIFLFQKRIYGWLYASICNREKPAFPRVKRWFASSISVTLSAMSVTTPLCAHYFGTVSIIGIVTNLLTLWVISFIFYGIMLSCVIGTFAPAAACFVGKMISWPIRYVLWMAKGLSAFPLAAVYTRSVYIVAWLVFYYLLLAVFLISRKKQPGLLFGCALFGLCLCLCASWLEPLTDECRMTVLNVGQGQCILLQSEGKTFMVDCGGDYDEDAADLAAETLLSQGITRIDGMILTHFDEDHAGGAEELLSRITADLILIPDYRDEHGKRDQLEEKYGNLLYPVQNDIQLTYGETKVSVYGPAIPDSGNESSLAVLFECQNCDILISGDRSGFGERLLLKTARLPQIDVLVAGHHGSADSTCEELLAAVRPEIVVISVGENRYGHPAQEVLDRLDDWGCLVYRTDLHGNIILRR